MIEPGQGVAIWNRMLHRGAKYSCPAAHSIHIHMTKQGSRALEIQRYQIQCLTSAQIRKCLCWLDISRQKLWRPSQHIFTRAHTHTHTQTQTHSRSCLTPFPPSFAYRLHVILPAAAAANCLASPHPPPSPKSFMLPPAAPPAAAERGRHLAVIPPPPKAAARRRRPPGVAPARHRRPALPTGDGARQPHGI